MKLVDKELLLEQARNKSYSRSSVEFLNSQKEVKAIPIDWLLNHQRVDGNDNILELIKLWESEQEENKDFVDWLKDYKRWK